jgi:LPXTG-motif cell wall-anchored protein
MSAIAGTVVLTIGLGVAGGIPSASAAESPIALGRAASHAVLGGSTVTNTGPSVLNGDLGLSPGSSITGFPPGVANGSTHAADAPAAGAQTDLITAYNDATSRTSTGAIAADLGGQTLVGGVYDGGALGLTGTLTLDGAGDASSVWIFRAASSLTTASSSSVSLIGGASACNVFWQVTSSATLGTGSSFAGSIMALTSITATTGATVNGRLLARNGAVTLDSNTVTSTGCAAATPATTTTSSTTTTRPPTTTTRPPTTATTAVGSTPTTTAVGSTSGTPTTTVGAPGATTTTAVGGFAAVTTTTPPAGSSTSVGLPRTGADTWGMFLLGLIAVVLGTTLVHVSRRRRATVDA